MGLAFCTRLSSPDAAEVCVSVAVGCVIRFLVVFVVVEVLFSGVTLDTPDEPDTQSIRKLLILERG